MIEIMKNIQQDFLELTAELVTEKEAFNCDLKMVQDTDCDIIDRKAAQKRLVDGVLEAGEYIGHGDQLTFQKFYDGLRLSQTGVTAIERLEFIRYFRIALFHTKMSKVFMDYKASMADDDNVDDVLSLSWFKAWLGLKDITNQESKIKKPGNFEFHDQFITELGLQFLANAFTNYLEANEDIPEITTTAEAEQFILSFLEHSGVKFFFDPDNCEEQDKFNDLLSYCRDLCSRTVLSIVFDKMEEEGDALGLRAFRTSMIIYFLNRKQTVQDSKYA